MHICALGRFTKIKFLNFDNSTQFLSYIYQDKKLVENASILAAKILPHLRDPLTKTAITRKRKFKKASKGAKTTATARASGGLVTKIAVPYQKTKILRAENMGHFLAIFGQFRWKERYLSKTSFLPFFCIDKCNSKTECYCQNSKILFL